MLKKIRSLVSNSNSFVEIYDNALPVEECDIIISEIEKSPQQEGRLKQNNQSVVLPDYKSCVELYDTKFSKGDIISNIVKHRLIECIEKYRKRYSSLDLLNFWGIDDFYNVQKYNGEDDGYLHPTRVVSLVNASLEYKFNVKNSPSVEVNTSVILET